MADPTYCPWILGAPCMKPEVWAAWWQAAGSVLAILVAVWIPASIAKKDRRRIERENAYRASSLAFVLEPALENLRGTLSQAAGQWQESPVRFVQGDGVALVLPDALTERLVDLHILGEAARPIHVAIVATNRLIDAVNTQDAHWRYGGEYVDEHGKAYPIPEPVPSVEEHLDAAKGAAARAISKLREVHGV
ncbi:hypothetical protein ABQ137_07980 [Xanthomonas sp. WHRI 8393]|uniref:hypothetical protein n=1 Tax=Xanthomonas sp. WHRI 8393 TaxID=3161574 RepID=UPI0032E8DA77